MRRRGEKDVYRFRIPEFFSKHNEFGDCLLPLLRWKWKFLLRSAFRLWSLFFWRALFRRKHGVVSYRRVHQEVQKIRYDRRKICLCLLVDDYFNILLSAGASDSSDLIYRDRVYRAALYFLFFAFLLACGYFLLCSFWELLLYLFNWLDEKLKAGTRSIKLVRERIKGCWTST